MNKDIDQACFSSVLRPIVAIGIAGPIRALESFNKCGNEGLDSLLRNYYMESLTCDGSRICRTLCTNPASFVKQRS